MRFTARMKSPLGDILLAADEKGLTGLWFDRPGFHGKELASEHEEGNPPVFEETRRWLEIYFQGKEPDFMPAIHLTGSPFRMSVWKILREIPYGETTTYGEIAKRIARERGISRMSAQAVGNAVGHNPVGILVPCHRVVGSDGSLTGYAGGLDKKAALLRLEGIRTGKETGGRTENRK